MTDIVLDAMQVARKAILEEKQKGLATREGSIALTQLETAILWREWDLLIQNDPDSEIAIKAKGLAPRLYEEGEIDKSKKPKKS
jgi:hypothetical protein